MIFDATRRVAGSSVNVSANFAHTFSSASIECVRAKNCRHDCSRSSKSLMRKTRRQWSNLKQSAT
jgi:hypothetical protein